MWQRDLLRRLAHGPLTREGEDEILGMIVGAANAPAPRPIQVEDLPSDKAEAVSVELRALSDVKNVNLLADGQSLRFKPGINIVYGHTGAGKSGYGRLLRYLSRSAVRPELLPNVFEEDASGKAQSAVVDAVVEGEPRRIEVDLAGEPDRALSAMAAFDGASAPLYLAGPNVIEHIPQSLLLLRRMAEAQEALIGRIKERIRETEGSVPPLPQIDATTPAGQFTATISHETDPAQVERFARLTRDEESELQALGTASLAFGSGKTSDLEAVAVARAEASSAAFSELMDASARLSDERIQGIGELRGRLDEVAAAEHALATKAFARQRFANTGEAAWRDMWDAARRFVEAGGATFPDDGRDAACPLCQRAFDKSTRQRVSKFEEFVSSDLRSQIAGLSQEISRGADELPELAAVRTRVGAYLSGAPTDVTAAAKEVLDALDQRLEHARASAEGRVAERAPLAPPPDISRIRAYAEEQAKAAKAQVELRDETVQQRMAIRLAELRARQDLIAAMPAIRSHIDALREVERLRGARRDLGTGKISYQLRSLQESTVTSRLRTAIAAELEGFGLLQGRVEFVSKAAKGRTAIQLWLKEPCNVKATEVLSEGEQRAVALSFFLAESAAGPNQSAIILDDPFSLLDGQRREHLARRIVEESERRQVIVLTHDLDAVELLRGAAEAAKRDLHGQMLRHAFNKAGIVIDELPEPSASKSQG